jgi:hypothetical protein
VAAVLFNTDRHQANRLVMGWQIQHRLHSRVIECTHNKGARTQGFRQTEQKDRKEASFLYPSAFHITLDKDRKTGENARDPDLIEIGQLELHG